MKFKIDENLPVEIAELLRLAGHDASTVKDQGMSGSADAHVINACSRENRVLVTLDLDFADIRTYPPHLLSGIMVIRVTRQDRKHLLDVFRPVIATMSDEPVQNRLWIIEENRIRIQGSEEGEYNI